MRTPPLRAPNLGSDDGSQVNAPQPINSSRIDNHMGGYLPVSAPWWIVDSAARVTHAPRVLELSDLVSNLYED